MVGNIDDRIQILVEGKRSCLYFSSDKYKNFLNKKINF